MEADKNSNDKDNTLPCDEDDLIFDDEFDFLDDDSDKAVALSQDEQDISEKMGRHMCGQGLQVRKDEQGVKLMDYLPRNELSRALVRTASFLLKLGLENDGKGSDGDSDDIKFDAHLVLLAIYTNSQLTRYFAKSLKVPAFKLRFPSAVYQLQDQLASKTGLVEEDLENAKDWYKTTYKALGSTVASSLADMFSELPDVEDTISSEDFATYLIHHLPGETSDGKIFSDWVHKLNPRYTLAAGKKESSQLKTDLSTHVKGQPQAVRAIVENEVNRSFGGSKRLRGLYTFVGASGVGKTEMARQYAQAITHTEGTHYKFHQFNMEQYALEKSYSKLSGVGRQFSEPTHGELTKLVMFNPRSIILFDEIEKAHKQVIQSLLTLIDTGRMVDNTTGEETDFSQCIIIFTSNLGAKEFSASKRLGTTDIFDVLENASYDNGERLVQLTPEFVNRLGAGTCVQFKPLNALNFFEIAENQLQNYTSPQAFGPQFIINSNMAGLLALSRLPDITARAIPQALDQLIGHVSNHLFHSRALESNVDDIETVELTLEDGFYAEGVKREPICFIGGSEQAATEFDNGLGDYSITHHKDADSLKQNITRLRRCDAIVLDAEHLSEQSLHECLELLSEYTPVIPTIVLGHVDTVNPVFDPVWKVISSGEIAAKASRLQRLLEVSWRIRFSERRNQTLDYQFDYQIKGAALVCNIHSPRYSQVVDSKRLQKGVPGLVQERPSIRMHDVIGLQRAKSQLSNALKMLRNTEFLKQEKIKMPAGIILTGPPGTGKTMLAKAVAGETQLKFISINISELISTGYGGTTRHIQELFDAARDIAPSIIFIDEIDAIAAHRSADTSAASMDRNGSVNTLLTCLDGLNDYAEPVFVIAATNNPEMLDPAIVRPGRLDMPIMCDLPDKAARKEFLTKFAHNYDVKIPAEDYEHFASLTMGLSGAQMEKVFTECRMALLMSRLDSNADSDDSELELTPEALRAAIATARFGALNDGPRLSEQARRITAWHEAGHLLASKVLTPDAEIPFATIEPRNQAQGFIVSQRDMSNGASTLSEIKAQIAVCLAGREGERMLGDDFEITAGASQDIKMATALARHAITTQGLDDVIGQVNVDVLSQHGISRDLKQTIEGQINLWLKQGRETARKLLIDRKSTFERIAEALYTKESLYADDIERLVAVFL